MFGDVTSCILEREKVANTLLFKSFIYSVSYSLPSVL